MPVAQRAQVIDPKNMVGVSVGIQHGVDLRNLFADGLRIKVWSRVDQYDLIVVFEHDRRTRSPVVGIARVADRALASQSGHAHRRPTAQHGQSGFHLPWVPVAGPACGRASELVTSMYAMRSS